MRERGDDLGTARALGEQEDVLRMMTIHKSKVWNFPLFSVAGLYKKFNLQDVHNNVVLDKELGIGCQYIDPEKRVAYPTLPHWPSKKESVWLTSPKKCASCMLL